MRILVTGANGYIGQGVVKTLLDRGVDLIATDVKLDLVDKRAVVKEANLFDIEDPYNYFGQPDVLLHLAWRDGFKHDSENHINDLPLHYSYINKMAQSGVRKIAAMGSVHEIGFFEGSVNENTPCNPQSLYGISKNALRQAAQLVAKNNGILIQWIRGYYIVGNTESGCSVFSKITQAEKGGDKTFPFTNGDNQFDFMNYDDFCHGIVDIVLQDEILGIINCCSGKPVKIADRVEQFISDNGYSIRLQYGAFPDRPYDSKAIWGDDTKLQTIRGNYR